MANLNRSAKSSSDWNEYDLDAYNIKIQPEDRATFFGDPNLPLPVIDEEILTTLKAENMLSDQNAGLIHLLDLAMLPVPAGESVVDDFTVELLKQLSYVKRNRIAHTRKEIPYLICGEWRHAKPDICLLDPLKNDILLLVQEDKHLRPDPCDPRSQLIAEAIAAFDYNNRGDIKSKACGSCIFMGVLYSLVM